MRVHCLQHTEHVVPANVQEWTDARGHELHVTHVYAGDALPDPGTVDLLVVLGGPMNIYMENEHPWLRTEKAWLRTAIEQRVPMLGICLGSQLLADLLGGPVTVGGAREIGWWPVRRTAAGAQSSVFSALPERFESFSWHSDTWRLPAGATLGASSDACENQAFEYDGFAYGVQFHPEFSHASTRQLAALPTGQVVAERWVQEAHDFLAAPERFDGLRDVLFDLLDAIAAVHAPDD